MSATKGLKLKNLELSEYNTDKFGFEGLNYRDSYAFHFLPLEKDIKVFYEVGIYQGGSLELWADLFPEALIVGLDIDPKCVSTRKNVVVEKGDATDPVFLQSIMDKYGKPDVFLDDASHLSSHMKKTFEIMYPHTKLLYCIEDLCTQYPGAWGGQFCDEGKSMVEYLFQMVHANNAFPGYDGNYNQICFNKSQAYIYKKKLA